MAVVTFTFGPKSKTYNITAGSLTRLSAWAAAAYPTIPNPAYNPGLPVDPGTNPLTIPNPDPTTSAIDGLWAGIMANIQSSEKATSVAAIVAPAAIT